MVPHLLLTALLGASFASAVLADASRHTCLPGGGGRLEMQISGDFEAAIDWGDEGTQCAGGPRPAGDALRLMFSRDDDGLLVVLGITGLERGRTGKMLYTNLTVVRQGAGEFYGTLGAPACLVEVEQNIAIAGRPDEFQVGGRGRCEQPVAAIGRTGEIRIAPFTFNGMAHWPEDDRQ